MAFDVATIDGIARKLGRDVLFLALLDEENESLDIYAEIGPTSDWLEAHGIIYCICTAFEEGVVYIEGGPSCVYLEVVPKTDLSQFAALVDKFGPVGGPQSLSGFKLSVLTLKDALKNAEQDDPNFWDNLV
jgi:hypothetical protein